MSDQSIIIILLLAPLLGAIINGVRFRSHNVYIAGVIASSAIAVSFVAAVILFFKLLSMPEQGRIISAELFNWINVEELESKAAFIVDPISIIMILVITGVGSLIHIFSIGYMSHDKSPAKYFSYLNFFVFNMLLLVLGENLLVMFVGWEGVGLCSYLLIGFWFKDKEKAAAGMKAFVTNRIGDAVFLLGIFLLFATFGTVSFSELAQLMPATAEIGWAGPITLSCLFLFIGATGKSAQIPLYVWLPDAMAGPTPVSALIHAATMVTAGVYMIVRMSPIFIMAPNAMLVVASVGAVTALGAATIGLTQWDIKKVLAYSTVSQLGYMFLGCGVGAFMPALFHLMTHAFFKALMFLGSGSIIHSLDGEQDIRKMGGLKKALPITYLTFVMGWIAIIGIPPFAGFFSKDEILWHSYMSPRGGFLFWFIGVVGAVCTAFYMTRLMALVFWGKSRVAKEHHPHESPLLMTVPLIVLAVLSVVGGWIGIPHVIGKILPGHPENLIHEWLMPVIATINWPKISAATEWSLMGISVGAAGVSAWLAYECYIKNPDLIANIVKKIKPLHHAVANKYFVDEFYFSWIINPIIDLSKGLWVYIDVNFIDNITYILADLIKSAAGALKTIQNGDLQQYALYIVFGVVGSLIYLVVM
ncbi:MAG: NADH-quinone oxidoreductase subunit L [Bdellovibrionales bacterium RBG_16_40_8]|nr:MAG: NADH-quinone oxidoreductase subunit L [Bdellovibrionales bacterium RBG_16_40_8]